MFVMSSSNNNFNFRIMATFNLSKIMKMAHAMKKDGNMSMSLALKLSWAEAKAMKNDVFCPDVFVLKFWKKGTGELTERRALKMRAGKGGAMLFVSLDDNMEFRSFRPELLEAVTMDSLTAREITMVEQYQQHAK